MNIIYLRHDFVLCRNSYQTFHYLVLSLSIKMLVVALMWYLSNFDVCSRIRQNIYDMV
jgi:hypothetical protein